MSTSPSKKPSALSLTEKLDLKNYSYDEVKVLAKRFAKQNNYSSSSVYEWISRGSGFKSWNAFSAYLKNK